VVGKIILPEVLKPALIVRIGMMNIEEKHLAISAKINAGSLHQR
jgi:hypothetical protein